MMEEAVIKHFKEYQNSKGEAILGCKHISRRTGFKQRQVFALLNKSPQFRRVDGISIGYLGFGYNLYSLNNC